MCAKIQINICLTRFQNREIKEVFPETMMPMNLKKKKRVKISQVKKQTLQSEGAETPEAI